MQETQTTKHKADMFFFLDPVSIAAGIKFAQLERDRFNALSPEQKQIELRQREVRALERIAEAQEEKNRITRNRFF